MSLKRIFRWINALRVQFARRKGKGRLQFNAGRVRRLFVDVSVVSKSDAGTGIQRVVRNIGERLIGDPPAGWDVIPVAATRKRGFREIAWPVTVQGEFGELMAGHPGDIFIGLDFSLDAIYLHARQLRSFKRCGGTLWFLMYDLLPLNNPDWFSDRMVLRFRRWIRVLASYGDAFFCISPVVRDALLHALDDLYHVSEGLQTYVIPMGVDMLTAGDGGAAVDCQARKENLFLNESFVLMVGTIEPRKAHADVLAAFEVLWSQGVQTKLVLVGRRGWQMESFEEVLLNHEMINVYLFWLEAATDELLVHLYRECEGVIAASYAEGFGLPLIEALAFGKRVLARDIPVFRLQEPWGVCYFDANADKYGLAKVIQTWLKSDVQSKSDAVKQVYSWENAVLGLTSQLPMD